LITDRMSTGAV